MAQWETLYEGTAETESMTGWPCCSDRIDGRLVSEGAYFAHSEIVRLTVNGTAYEFVAEYTDPEDLEKHENYKHLLYAGNWGITYGASDGEDFCVHQGYTGLFELYILTRNPGTYTVKIERLTVSTIEPKALLG